MFSLFIFLLSFFSPLSPLSLSSLPSFLPVVSTLSYLISLRSYSFFYSSLLLLLLLSHTPFAKAKTAFHCSLFLFHLSSPSRTSFLQVGVWIFEWQTYLKSLISTFHSACTSFHSSELHLARSLHFPYFVHSFFHFTANKAHTDTPTYITHTHSHTHTCTHDTQAQLCVNTNWSSSAPEVLANQH